MLRIIIPLALEGSRNTHMTCYYDGFERKRVKQSMKIQVTVKPNARKESVERKTGDELVVCVKDSPVDGKANRALIQVLADYFSVPKSAISILHGERSRKKLIQIEYE